MCINTLISFQLTTAFSHRKLIKVLRPHFYTFSPNLSCTLIRRSVPAIIHIEKNRRPFSNLCTLRAFSKRTVFGCRKCRIKVRMIAENALKSIYPGHLPGNIPESLVALSWFTWKLSSNSDWISNIVKVCE